MASMVTPMPDHGSDPQAAAQQLLPSEPNKDNPAPATGEQVASAVQLSPEEQAALLEIRRTFKLRWQPKRMVFVREGMRAFEALRGNTYALLNDRNAALDTINQLMQGLIDGGDDDDLHDHNENIYQMFCMSFIAALMVNLGKVRYTPADADDEADQEISRKGSTIQAFNERKNDEEALKQLQLLYLWTTGSYWRYTRYVIDSVRGGINYEPDVQIQQVKVTPDGYICPKCSAFTPDDDAATPFSGAPHCKKCGNQLKQSSWYEGQYLNMPVKVGDIETPGGLAACDIVNGLMVDSNPDAMTLAETELLDYTIDISAGKLRSAFPKMYDQIQPMIGTDAGSDGDASRMARNAMTTPGTNNKPMTVEGLCSYSRCWITPDGINELQDKNLAASLRAKFPKGCRLMLCGTETFLGAVPEALTDHWTWCGTLRGTGLYPFPAGKVVLDVQERVTDIVNIEHAYLARLAFGTILYDADFIDGDALTSRVLSPGNMTPVSRTDEETGISKPLGELMYQPEFRIDPEIFKQVQALTMRAHLLAAIMPQIFGGSDPNVQTKGGQEQALNTALGRLKQYVNQMRGENAQYARVSVKCSIDNMDEELKIVEEGDTRNTYQTVKLLKSQLTGDFFTYPETAEGFPSTFEQIRDRIMQLLSDPKGNPWAAQIMSDPDNAAAVARYVMPDEMTLPGDEQRAKVKNTLTLLSQGKPGLGPNPKQQPGTPPLPPVPIPSIMPDIRIDDPSVCATLAKKWLLKNWQQLDTNPNGYSNVLAYLTVCAQFAKENQAAAAITAQQQQQNQGQSQAA